MSTEKLVIIDYGSGNLRSAAKAFEHVISASDMALDVVVSDKSDDIDDASFIVLPGQGAFGDCMSGLEQSGLIGAMENNVLDKGKPFLGICVGMQLLADEGLEHGHHKGLGWIGGKVDKLPVNDESLKIPHMGWNEHIQTEAGNNHQALKDIKNGTHFYFVHSYVFDCDNDDHVLGQFEYGGVYTSIIGRDNIVGVQFHPEKSHDNGLLLLKKFLEWEL